MNQSPLISNRAYDIMKWVVQLLLPALGTLYFTLGNIWSLSNVEQVCGTILAIATFLGATLRISTKSYLNSDAPYDGNLIVTEDDEGSKTVVLEVSDNLDLYEIDKKDSVAFKVRPFKEPPSLE